MLLIKNVLISPKIRLLQGKWVFQGSLVAVGPMGPIGGSFGVCLVLGMGGGGSWKCGERGKNAENRSFLGQIMLEMGKNAQKGHLLGKKWLKTAHFLGKPAENR